jgi:hypothetical protein
LEYGNFSFSNNKKISFYVFNIANIYLGIYFSDSSNLIKNFNYNNNNSLNANESSKSQFYYVDCKTGNSIKFDNFQADSYLSKKTGISEDLYKKLEAMRQFNKKYEKTFFEKICENKNFYYTQSESNTEIDYLHVKKLIKNENVILLKLSSKIMQIFFMDNSKLAMTMDGEEVLYKNKKADEFVLDSLANVLNSQKNIDLISKIKYAKSLLISFVRKEKDDVSGNACKNADFNNVNGNNNKDNNKNENDNGEFVCAGNLKVRK